jgi:hypothetical protein
MIGNRVKEHRICDASQAWPSAKPASRVQAVQTLEGRCYRTERQDGERFSDHRRRLATSARAVEADSRLNADMADWEAATIGDGLDQLE